MNLACKWNQLSAAKIHLFCEYLSLHTRNMNPHDWILLQYKSLKKQHVRYSRCWLCCFTVSHFIGFCSMYRAISFISSLFLTMRSWYRGCHENGMWLALANLVTAHLNCPIICDNRPQQFALRCISVSFPADVELLFVGLPFVGLSQCGSPMVPLICTFVGLS